MSHVEHCHEEEPYFSSSALMVVVALSLVTGLLTGAGNSLVVASVYLFRSLRTHSNFFLVSLAVADLSVGLVAIPLYCIGAITWPHTLGTLAGYALDFLVMLSLTASSLNLVAVSYDRHLAISSPLRYSSLMSQRRCRTIIVLVWFVSVAIASPSFIAKDLNSRAILNVVFIIISFVFPLVVLIFVQCGIFKAVRRQLAVIQTPLMYMNIKDIAQEEKMQAAEDVQVQQKPKMEADNVATRDEHANEARSGIVTDLMSLPDEKYSKELTDYKNRDVPHLKRLLKHLSSSSQSLHFNSQTENGRSMESPEKRLFQGVNLQRNRSLHHDNRHCQIRDDRTRRYQHFGIVELPNDSFVLIKQTLKHHRHTITLALVIGCFTLCWLPTFVLVIIQASDSALCSIIKHEQIYFVTLLLALANSLLNPFIYCARMSEFRRSFVKILKCRALVSVELIS